MGYYIEDVNDYQGDLATSLGLEELKKYAASRKLFNIVGFITTGAALITEVLMEEVRSAKPANKNIRKTLEDLLVTLEKSELAVYIRDGVNG